MQHLNSKFHFIKQRGVVLFVALIALVVMSLAAAALIRSVDTNTLITGNLSFKQSAVVSSDRGIETALTWVNTAAVANLAALDGNSVANGYFSTFDEVNLDDRAVLKDAATWTANSAVATGTGITAGREDDTGNEIRYIVQRMCRDPVAPTKENCQFGEAEVGSGSKGVKDASEAGAIIDGAESPIYRVTVRVVGPKNTVSYTQTYVY
jgi:type IV pilus assembly protein PilX